MAFKLGDRLVLTGWNSAVKVYEVIVRSYSKSVSVRTVAHDFDPFLWMISFSYHIVKSEHLTTVSLVNTFNRSDRNTTIVMANSQVFQLFLEGKSTRLLMRMQVTLRACSTALLLRRQGFYIRNCGDATLTYASFCCTRIKQNRIIIA